MSWGESKSEMGNRALLYLWLTVAGIEQETRWWRVDVVYSNGPDPDNDCGDDEGEGAEDGRATNGGESSINNYIQITRDHLVCCGI